MFCVDMVLLLCCSAATSKTRIAMAISHANDRAKRRRDRETLRELRRCGVFSLVAMRSLLCGHSPCHRVGLACEYNRKMYLPRGGFCEQLAKHWWVRISRDFARPSSSVCLSGYPSSLLTQSRTPRGLIREQERLLYIPYWCFG